VDTRNLLPRPIRDRIDLVFMGINNSWGGVHDDFREKSHFLVL
jgi:hypothetical protein